MPLEKAILPPPPHVAMGTGSPGPGGRERLGLGHRPEGSLASELMGIPVLASLPPCRGHRHSRSLVLFLHQPGLFSVNYLMALLSAL